MPPLTGTTQGFHYNWNGFPAYGTYQSAGNLGLTGGFDNSIYHLAMLKFVQTGPTSIQVNLIETPLVSRLSNSNGLGPSNEDLFGDGLSDLVTSVGCTNRTLAWGNGAQIGQCATIADGVYGPNAPLPDGTPLCNGSTCTFDTNSVLYANVNQGVTGGALSAMQIGGLAVQSSLTQSASASLSVNLGYPGLPGLAYSATNGLGDQAIWGYSPLSLPVSQAGIPLYQVPATGGYVDGRHYYFTSSMPVVNGFAQSDGIGGNLGFRTAVYGYEQAMYNHYGRGFQGFYAITSEVYDQISRLSRTRTQFNQKFPLTGKVAVVTNSVPNLTGTTNTVVQKETDTWRCNRADRTQHCPGDGGTLTLPTGTAVYQPFLDDQLVQNYDLATGTAMSHVDTLNATSASATISGWDNNTCGIGGSTPYGNLNNQLVTRVDDASGGVFVSSHTTATTNCYDVSGAGSWWVDKLINSSLTSSITYASGHALPSGTSAPNQTVASSYTFNADRTPATKSVQSGIANQRSTTTYTYPTTSYGLPKIVQVNAPDLASGLSPTRTTNFTYTKAGTAVEADGYFVYTAMNGLNQTTTTQHEPNDGQVTTATDPNGIKVVTTYDPFGRATNIAHNGTSGVAFESPIKIAYTKCASGSCPGGVAEDGHETNAAYRVTSVQNGYPTKVAWYDLLGREIKTAERGYTGTFIETLTLYDNMNMVSEKFSPFYAGGATYFTSWTYDSLNRPTVKIASASDMDPTHGDFVTNYTYNGKTTNIIAHGSRVTCPGTSSNLCISMSRSRNVLGQYMQTVDANGKQTNYWTEPLGHVAAITDAQGNITSASYNALGLRTQSNDPDQGNWTFTYDALGELLTQTDARNIVTSVVARDVLGRTTERQEVPPVSVPQGTANETVDDTFTFDPSNGIGEPGGATRRRGSNRTTPSSNPVTWTESYSYEATTARLSTTTTSVTEANVLNLQTTESYDTYGRPLNVGYPSGLSVQTQYGKYGHSGALANAGTSQLWWEVTAMDAWNGITAESFVDGTTGTRVRYGSSGQDKTASWKLGTPTVDTLSYVYDSFGNLGSQTRTAGSASNTETYVYDKLQRLSTATRSVGGAAVSYGYSDNGNLTSKSDFASLYSYAAPNSRSSGCGPHAAYQVTLTPSGTGTYTCDADGNVYASNVRALQLTYNADNQPRTSTASGGNMSWGYDAYGHMSYETSATRGNRVFGPHGYEQVLGGAQIHELGPIIVTRQSGTDKVTTALRDRLGSTIDTIDSGLPGFGNTRTYDAFGAVRNGDMTGRSGGTLNLGDTIHGFTRHDHADEVQLMHMGGRIYDYELGRFLSVDPIIGNPSNSQNLNPYSYIGNNPLSGTDPTGYATCAASEVASTSECAQAGVHTIVAEDGGKTTLVVGNQGDRVRLTDTATHISNLYTIGNGAQKLDYSNILSMNVPADKIQSLTSNELGPAKTAAMLSKCAYGSCVLPANVMPTDLGFNEQHHINPGLYDDAGAQFHAESFVSNDGADAYLAFRGTRPTNMQDWVTNFRQGAGLKTKSYQDAVSLGSAFSQGVPDSTNKTYVGHSLGGGLASLAGITSGERTITFNSAGLSSGTLARYGVTPASANGLVSAYYLRGEVLSGLQDHSPLPKAVGARIPIDPISSTPWSPIARHGMDSVLDAMNGSQ